MKIRNSDDVTPDVIVDQMNEPRPLPMGMAAFEDWAERIISGALLPGGEDDPDAFRESQVFVLSDMLLHLGPTESHKPDAFFIHGLRKVAVNQVAFAVKKEIGDKKNARAEADKKSKEQEASETAAAATEERIKAESERHAAMKNEQSGV